jgi:hypothetical protein
MMLAYIAPPPTAAPSVPISLDRVVRCSLTSAVLSLGEHREAGAATRASNL